MNFEDFDGFINGWWPIIISLVLTIIGTIRVYMGGPTCPNDIRIDGKVVLITGASGGIGLATAKELAKRGGEIILTCRNEDKGKVAMEMLQLQVPEAKVTLNILDISSLENIRNFVKDVSKQYEKIDILINNAGIAFHQFQKTSEDLEITFVTNYLGPFLLTHLLLPLLRKSENARIINLTSLAHFSARLDVRNLNFCKEFIFREVYGQTKLALVLFTKQFSKLTKGSNIVINSVNPGIVRDTNHMKMSPLANSWMTRISVFPWTWLFLKTPRQGCQSILYAATDLLFEHTTGVYISDCSIKEASDLTKDEKLLQGLYEKSCEMSGIDQDYYKMFI